jgi:hypothetical protein
MPGSSWATNNFPDSFHTFLMYPRKLKCHHNTDMVPTNDANVRDPFVSSCGLSRQSPVPGTWPCQMRGQLRRCGHPWSCRYAISWSCFQPAFRSCLQQHNDAEVSSTMAKKQQFLDKLQVLQTSWVHSLHVAVTGTSHKILPAPQTRPMFSPRHGRYQSPASPPVFCQDSWCMPHVAALTVRVMSPQVAAQA